MEAQNRSADELVSRLTVISDAVIDATASAAGEVTYLPGYDGTLDLAALGWVAVRLIVALYLVSSSLARYDARELSWLEVGLRLLLAVLVLLKLPTFQIGGLVAALMLVTWHYLGSRRTASA